MFATSADFDQGGVSAQQARRMSVNAGNTPSSTTSGLGSPMAMLTPRSSAVDTMSPRTPQGRSIAVLGSPSPRSGSSGASIPFGFHVSPVFQAPVPQSLKGVPEVFTVEEMAFRQGQADHGVFRDKLPSNPYSQHFDKVWLKHYTLGREVGGTPVSASSFQRSTTLQNFPWPVLINPYTQDLARPEGTVDAEWVRKICEIALGCMATLVSSVCRRQGDWKKTVCDVPSPVKQAIMHFEDLQERYEDLQKDAKEALAGGLPVGY